MNKIKVQDLANLLNGFICTDDPKEFEHRTFNIYRKEPSYKDESNTWDGDWYGSFPNILFEDADDYDEHTIICPQKIDSNDLKSDSINPDLKLFKISVVKQYAKFSNRLKDVYVIDNSIDNACRKIKEYVGEDFLEIKNIKIKGTNDIFRKSILPKLIV